MTKEDLRTLRKAELMELEQREYEERAEQAECDRDIRFAHNKWQYAGCGLVETNAREEWLEEEGF